MHRYIHWDNYYENNTNCGDSEVETHIYSVDFYFSDVGRVERSCLVAWRNDIDKKEREREKESATNKPHFCHVNTDVEFFFFWGVGFRGVVGRQLAAARHRSWCSILGPHVVDPTPPSASFFRLPSLPSRKPRRKTVGLWGPWIGTWQLPSGEISLTATTRETELKKKKKNSRTFFSHAPRQRVRWTAVPFCLTIRESDRGLPFNHAPSQISVYCLLFTFFFFVF